MALRFHAAMGLCGQKNYIIRCWIEVLHQIYEANISLVEVFILGKLTLYQTVGEYGK